jgi:hypothetical protein
MPHCVCGWVDARASEPLVLQPLVRVSAGRPADDLRVPMPLASSSWLYSCSSPPGPCCTPITSTTAAHQPRTGGFAHERSVRHRCPCCPNGNRGGRCSGVGRRRDAPECACASGRVLVVTLVGTFSNLVLGAPGEPGPVTSLTVKAEPSSGTRCASGVTIGHGR